MRLKEVCDFLDEQRVDFKVIGNLENEIKGYSALNEYSSGSITWVRGRGNVFRDTKVDFAVTEEDCIIPIQNRIVCTEPKEVFFMIMSHFFDDRSTYKSSSYTVGGDVNLGENVIIGNGTILDGNISIGDGTIIGYGVKLIGRVQIGKNCVIKSGVVIGESDIDFYFSEVGDRNIKKQYGGVKVGENVIIGPNTVINRGSLGNTTIGNNVIIDDRCNISHNVKIGNNTAVISGTTLFGSVEVGNQCYISTSVIRNQVIIGDNVTVGMGSVVVNDLPSNVVAYGNPALIRKQK